MVNPISVVHHELYYISPVWHFCHFIVKRFLTFIPHSIKDNTDMLHTTNIKYFISLAVFYCHWKTMLQYL